MGDMSRYVDRGDDGKSFVTRRIAGETILVPVTGHAADLDAIYTLNEVGSFIWHLIDGRRSAQAIAEAVSAEFERHARARPPRCRRAPHHARGKRVFPAVARAGEGHVKTATYGAFSDQIHRAAVSRNLPLDGTFEMTHRCPLTCAHCYNNLPMGDTAARDRELTRDEHYRLLDELVEAGGMWLLYTGGEIFARRDFLDIYTRARQNGFLITLFTNGNLVTARVADHLAAYRPFAIEITLYGRTRETYERLTGIPGSFDKCMRGIDVLLERGLPLALKTVAVSINKHEVWDMQRFADDLGVEFKFDTAMNPRIDCSQSPLAVRLSPEDVVAFDLEDPKRMNEWEIFAEKNFKPANPPVTPGRAVLLRRGRHLVLDRSLRAHEHLHPLPAGQVQICERERCAKAGKDSCATSAGRRSPARPSAPIAS